MRTNASVVLAIREESGSQDIGFILIFVISSMVLTLLTWMMSTLIERTTNHNVDAQVQAIGNRLVSSVEEVIHVSRSRPQADFSTSFELPTQIGSTQYRIEVGSVRDDPVLNLTTFDNKIKQTHNIPETQDISLSGSASSEGGRVEIVYDPLLREVRIRSI